MNNSTTERADFETTLSHSNRETPFNTCPVADSLPLLPAVLFKVSFYTTVLIGKSNIWE